MDLRVTKTRNAIINAFLELRAKKPLEKITVKELCEKAQIHKSTFYAHFQDIYALSEILEKEVAEKILAEVSDPEDLFQRPEIFVRKLFYAFLAQSSLILILFSGSRSEQLPLRIEASMRELLFTLRPQYRDDVTANVLFTMEIWGSYYAFQKCRDFGEDQVIDTLAAIDEKLLELFPEERR